jgi:hypothetical protein
VAARLNVSREVEAMASQLITKQRFEARLGRLVVQRIVEDAQAVLAGETNTEDADALDQILNDATSKLRGALGPVYSRALDDPNVSPELIRIGLDICQAYAAQRYPEYVRSDGFRLMKQADDDLTKIREGLSSLGDESASAEPAANTGARVSSGNPAAPLFVARRMSDNWGDFG